MKQRCKKCGGVLFYLWGEGKRSIWIACAICDKPELDEMKKRKLEDDIDKIREVNLMEYTKGLWYADIFTTHADIRAREGSASEYLVSFAKVYDALLICEAVNACIKINPDDPLAVAKSISGAFEALENVKIVFDNMSISRRVMIAPLITDVEQVLAKVK